MMITNKKNKEKKSKQNTTHHPLQQTKEN